MGGLGVSSRYEVPDRRPRPATAPVRALRLALLLLLLPLLAACAMVDPLTREICVSVLPALEADDARITVLAIDPDPAKAGNVRISSRAEAARGSHRTFLVCAFGLDPATGDSRALIGLRDHHGVMSDARFYMVRRFWLRDSTVVAEAASRVRIEPTALPHGLATLSAGAGRVAQHLIDTLAPASIYALLALAYAMIWSLLGRINFAFGDIAMLGAYGALIGAVVVKSVGAAAAGPLVVFAVLVALAVGISWGATLGGVVFARFAYRPNRSLLLATIGLSIALQEFVARSQGPRTRFFEPILNKPRLLFDGPFTVMVTPMRVLVVALAIGATASILLVFPRTRIGRAWKAVASDVTMAGLLGIDPVRVLVVSVTLASALAALAGAILTLAFGGTSFHMGTVLGLKAVVAAAVGGIGSLPGAALGGLLLGVLETGWSVAFAIEWRDTAILSLLVAFLIFRPTGLLGLPEPPGPRDRRT